MDKQEEIIVDGVTYIREDLMDEFCLEQMQ